MAGRPTRLTTAVIDEMTRALRAGASLRIAADGLGIPFKTALHWVRLGEHARECERRRCPDEHHGPRGGEVGYETFAVEVQKAIGQAGLRAAASVSAAFQRDPYVALKWLGKRLPGRLRRARRAAQRHLRQRRGAAGHHHRGVERSAARAARPAPTGGSSS